MKILAGALLLVALLQRGCPLPTGDDSTTTEELDLSIFDDPPQTPKPPEEDTREAMTSLADAPAYMSSGMFETYPTAQKGFPSKPISQPENKYQYIPPSQSVSTRHLQYLPPMSGMLPSKPFMPSNSIPYAPPASYIPSYVGTAPKHSVSVTTKKPLTSSTHGLQEPPYPYAHQLPSHSSIPGLSLPGNSYLASSSFIKTPQVPAPIPSAQYSQASGKSVPLASYSVRTYAPATPSLSFLPQTQGASTPIVATFVRTYVPSNQNVPFHFVNYPPTPITSMPSGVLSSSPSLSLNEILSSVANSYAQTSSNGLSPSFAQPTSYISMPSHTAPDPAAHIISSIIRTYPPTPIQSPYPFFSSTPIMSPQIYHNSNPSFSTYGNIPSVTNSWPSPY